MTERQEALVELLSLPIPPEIEKMRGYRVTQPTTNRSQSERDEIVKRLADEYVARRLLRKLGDIGDSVSATTL